MQIKINQKKNIWITSDTHYGHKNICRGVTDWRTKDGKIPINSTRDFASLDLMNDTIVNNINNCVGQDDVLIHLGDWSFGGYENIRKFRERIICESVYLIYGNHDHNIRNNRDNIKELFVETYSYAELVYDKNTFVLFHYPILSWNCISRGYVHLFGHQHSSPDKKFRTGKSMDIGIDTHEKFQPYNIKEIVQIMNKRPIAFNIGDDHHADDIINKVE